LEVWAAVGFYGLGYLDRRAGVALGKKPLGFL
jgi:hypothetical protein